uniref:Uncharacterized protein n=1 Tax=Vitis vinifera TaxID=29760 RepID=A5C878_VITVI|nr:hypothetical protein VITISV_035530 [Vitis vinifera]
MIVEDGPSHDDGRWEAKSLSMSMGCNYVHGMRLLSLDALLARNSNQFPSWVCPILGCSSLEKDLTSIGFNFLAKPTLEFQDDDHECGNCETARSGEGKFDKKQEEKEREEQEEEKCKVKVTPMDLKMSSLAEFKVEEDDDNDGFKTPTSVDHKIPLILPCPPAPKKPKSLPSTKRRAAGPNRRVLLDLSNEIQSLFPPDFGGKSKRLRQGGK